MIQCEKQQCFTCEAVGTSRREQRADEVDDDEEEDCCLVVSASAVCSVLPSTCVTKSPLRKGRAVIHLGSSTLEKGCFEKV